LGINLEGIVVIVGNYGSGKTEVAINLAVNRRAAGMDVRIADLDLVNPYFRTREARGPLSELGIEVVVPPEEYLNADLPILSPVIAGMVRRPTGLTLIDAGGDDVGVTVLAALADSFKNKDVLMLQVVNPYRPFTETVAGCLKIRDEIENASKMQVGGLIGNANLINETTVQDIYQGHDFMNALSEKSGLPVAFMTVSAELMTEIDLERFACSVLVLKRFLLLPWERR
jgi:hypothetical protein